MRKKFNIFIVEGIDRLGKDTLIANIQQKLGHHFVIHYSKPQRLEYYDNSLEKYQFQSFYNGFTMINHVYRNIHPGIQTPLIFNRFHLGETVYAPLYRGYSGDYVFELEEFFSVDVINSAKLILLKASNLEVLVDDGDGFNFANREKEQNQFQTAFDRSKFMHKQVIDVMRNGSWKNPQEILEEALQ